VYTPGAMQGYHHLPEETAAVMTADGGIRTGDLGTLDDDGYLTITGRVREVYKLENGKFVSPVPLEERLADSPFIAQALVYGLNRPHNVAVIVADMQAIRTFFEREGQGDSKEISASHPSVKNLLVAEVNKHQK